MATDAGDVTTCFYEWLTTLRGVQARGDRINNFFNGTQQDAPEALEIIYDIIRAEGDQPHLLSSLLVQLRVAITCKRQDCMAPKHDLRLPETNYAFFLACPEQPQSLQTLVNNTLEPSANSNTGIDAGFRLPCGHQQGFSVQRSILDPKDFIIIYLQRSVHQHGQADRIKRRTAVQIDRVLTLSATRRGEVESRPIQYNLVGFVSHIGLSPRFGHYKFYQPLLQPNSVCADNFAGGNLYIMPLSRSLAECERDCLLLLYGRVAAAPAV